MILKHSKSILSTFESYWVLGFGFWVRVLAYVTQCSSLRLAGDSTAVSNILKFQMLELTANWRKWGLWCVLLWSLCFSPPLPPQTPPSPRSLVLSHSEFCVSRSYSIGIWRGLHAG